MTGHSKLAAELAKPNTWMKCSPLDDAPISPMLKDGFEYVAMMETDKSNAMFAFDRYAVDLHWSHHCFRKGHKIMVQIQSTWFPLIDRNPQKYVPNIFEAKDSDFQAARQQVYRSPKYLSAINMQVSGN